MSGNRILLSILLFPTSTLLLNCASHAPVTDEPPAQTQSVAPGAGSEGEEKTAEPDSPHAQPVASKATRKYEPGQWCTMVKHKVTLAGELLGEPVGIARKEFDDQGRVVRFLQDTRGTGNYNKVSVTTYDPDGIHYTRKSGPYGEDKFEEVFEGRIAPAQVDHSLQMFISTVRINEDQFMLNAAGQRVGFRNRTKRYLRENGRSGSIEVEQVGITFLNDAGIPVQTFIIQGRDAEASIPSIDTLRAQFRFDKQAARWHVPTDPRWNVMSVFLFAYDDAGNKMAKAKWEAPTEKGVPTLQAILDAVGTDKPHHMVKIGSSNSWSNPSPRMPEEYADHLTVLELFTHDASGKVTHQRHYSHKPLVLSFDLQNQFDAQGHLTRSLLDTTNSRRNSTFADGIVDKVKEFTYANGELIERKDSWVTIDHDVPREQIPKQWRSLEFADVDGAATVPAKIVLESLQTLKHDAHGNLMIDQKKSIQGIRRMHYDTRGRLIKVDIDGEESGAISGHRRAKIQIRHTYNDEGQKLETVRVQRGFSQSTTTDWTAYNYNADGRLEGEAVRHQTVTGLGDEQRIEGPEPWIEKVHRYDAQGRKTKTIITWLKYPRFGKTISYLYDDQGRLIEEREIPNDRETTTHRYSYDAQGRLSGEEVQQLKRDQPHYRAEYHYNAQGQKTHMLHWGVTNVSPIQIPAKLRAITEYTYKDGQLFEETQQLTRQTLYTYACHEEETPRDLER